MMDHTKSQFLIESRLNQQFKESREIERRGRLMKEVTGASFHINESELIDFNSYRQHEYHQYREMIQGQTIRFHNYLNVDKFSRRLLIQFPSSWYDNKEENYMPCPESFIVFYNSDDSYEVVVNFRSTEVSRCSEDISVIKALCEKELVLPGKMSMMKIHCMNIHKYLDDGSSEDFDVTSGYYNRKDK